MSLLLYLFLLTHEWCPSLYLHLYVGGILYYFICFCLRMRGFQPGCQWKCCTQDTGRNKTNENKKQAKTKT
jgi:hypothetical protein